MFSAALRILSEKSKSAFFSCNFSEYVKSLLFPYCCHITSFQITVIHIIQVQMMDYALIFYNSEWLLSNPILFRLNFYLPFSYPYTPLFNYSARVIRIFVLANFFLFVALQISLATPPVVFQVVLNTQFSGFVGAFVRLHTTAGYMRSCIIAFRRRSKIIFRPVCNSINFMYICTLIFLSDIH